MNSISTLQDTSISFRDIEYFEERKNIARESKNGLSYFVISHSYLRFEENAPVKHYFSLLNDLSRRNRSPFSGDVNITYMLSHSGHIFTLVATLLDEKVKKCEMTLFIDDIG